MDCYCCTVLRAPVLYRIISIMINMKNTGDILVMFPASGMVRLFYLVCPEPLWWGMGTDSHDNNKVML